MSQRSRLLRCERLFGQLPRLIELLRPRGEIRSGRSDPLVDPRLGSITRSFGLSLKRLDLCVHFRLCLVKLGFCLLLRRFELFLRVFDLFLNCCPILGVGLFELIIESVQAFFQSSTFSDELIFGDFRSEAPGYGAAMLAHSSIDRRRPSLVYVRQYGCLPRRQRFNNVAVEGSADVGIVEIEEEPTRAAKRSAHNRTRRSCQEANDTPREHPQRGANGPTVGLLFKLDLASLIPGNHRP